MGNRAEFSSLAEMMQLAQTRLPDGVRDHIAGGAGTEQGVARNRWALDSLAFRPRVLRDVSQIDLSTTLLGHRLRIPVFLAPIGSLHTIDASAEAAALKAACDFGTIGFASSVAKTSIEELGRCAQGPKFYQLYVQSDLDAVLGSIERALAAGFSGVAVTVDSAYYGTRDRQLLHKWQPPAASRAEKRTHQARVTWQTVAELRRRLGDVPLMLKGIQTGEDARLAVEEGTDIVYVSNHGGRQLDHCRAAIDILPEVLDGVGSGVPVILDGGFMRGVDIAKALALGAAAVGLGRLYALALACGGEGGVATMLALLEDELRSAFGLLGVTAPDQLTADYVVHSPYGRLP